MNAFSPRSVALQGVGFDPLAVALQGLWALPTASLVDNPAPPRAAIVDAGLRARAVELLLSVSAESSALEGRLELPQLSCEASFAGLAVSASLSSYVAAARRGDPEARAFLHSLVSLSTDPDRVSTEDENVTCSPSSEAPITVQ
jgi:hypothetical protein